MTHGRPDIGPATLTYFYPGSAILECPCGLRRTSLDCKLAVHCGCERARGGDSGGQHQVSTICTPGQASPATTTPAASPPPQRGAAVGSVRADRRGAERGGELIRIHASFSAQVFSAQVRKQRASRVAAASTQRSRRNLPIAASGPQRRGRNVASQSRQSQPRTFISHTRASIGSRLGDSQYFHHFHHLPSLFWPIPATTVPFFCSVSTVPLQELLCVASQPVPVRSPVVYSRSVSTYVRVTPPPRTTPPAHLSPRCSRPTPPSRPAPSRNSPFWCALAPPVAG